MAHTHSDLNNERDKKALLVGGMLVFLVGTYFIGKNIFFTEKKSTSSVIPAVTDTKTDIPLITPEALLKKIQNGDAVAIIDVRDGALFQAEHLAHSLNFPIGSLENFYPTKDETVVIVFSGNDPVVFEAVRNIMNQKSFAYFFLKGGFEGWKSAGASVISFGDPDSFVDQSKVTYIKTEEYKKLAEQNNQIVFVLDVQTASNFKKKHLKGAVNIPLDKLEKRVSEIPVSRQIVVYGETDFISFQGGVRLSDLGIFSAKVLNGNDYFLDESGLFFEP